MLDYVIEKQSRRTKVMSEPRNFLVIGLMCVSDPQIIKDAAIELDQS